MCFNFRPITLDKHTGPPLQQAGVEIIWKSNVLVKRKHIDYLTNVWYIYTEGEVAATGAATMLLGVASARICSSQLSLIRGY